MSISEHKNYIPAATEAELLLKWLRRARESQFTHYAAARKLKNYGHLFGIPVIVIAAIIGTSAFASIATDTLPLCAKVITGFASIAAAVLSSLQTFFKFSERSEKHRLFAAKFGAVRRELEMLHARGDIVTNDLNSIRLKLDKLAEEAPNVEAEIFSRPKSSKIDATLQ